MCTFSGKLEVEYNKTLYDTNKTFFSNCLILIRVMMDPEPINGWVGKFTPDGMQSTIYTLFHTWEPLGKVISSSHNLYMIIYELSAILHVETLGTLSPWITYIIITAYRFCHGVWYIPTGFFQLEKEDGIMDRQEEQVSGHHFIKETQVLHPPDSIICNTKYIQIEVTTCFWLIPTLLYSYLKKGMLFQKIFSR